MRLQISVRKRNKNHWNEFKKKSKLSYNSIRHFATDHVESRQRNERRTASR